MIGANSGGGWTPVSTPGAASRFLSWKAPTSEGRGPAISRCARDGHQRLGGACGGGDGIGKDRGGIGSDEGRRSPPRAITPAERGRALREDAPDRLGRK